MGNWDEFLKIVNTDQQTQPAASTSAKSGGDNWNQFLNIIGNDEQNAQATTTPASTIVTPTASVGGAILGSERLLTNSSQATRNQSQTTAGKSTTGLAEQAQYGREQAIKKSQAAALVGDQKSAAAAWADVNSLEQLNPWLARGEKPTNEREEEIYAQYQDALEKQREADARLRVSQTASDELKYQDELRKIYSEAKSSGKSMDEWYAGKEEELKNLEEEYKPYKVTKGILKLIGKEDVGKESRDRLESEIQNLQHNLDVASGIRWYDFTNSDNYQDLSKYNEDNKSPLYHMVNNRTAPNGTLAKYNYLTDDEIGIYNALFASRGQDAATAFLDSLNLGEREYAGTTAEWREKAKNAGFWGKAGLTAGTVLMQPWRTLDSVNALAEDTGRFLAGEEIDPYSQFRRRSALTREVRGQISEDIQKGWTGDLGQFLYNAGSSAADSTMNMLTGGAIAKLLPLASADQVMKATNVIGSALMSSEVASLGVKDGLERGYSDAGALALGLIRGGVEYASEAMGGEWVIKNLKANPLNFFQYTALNMIPEGAEEVMSDAMNGGINLAVDAIFDTQESGIPQLIEHFKTEGTPWQKEHPELATVLAIGGEEMLSFLSGSFASLGSSGAQTINMRGAIDATASRLNTSQQNVVQLMQEMNFEDPTALYQLADLFDAESVSDLRQKMAAAKESQKYAEKVLQSDKAEETATETAKEAPVEKQTAEPPVTSAAEENVPTSETAPATAESTPAAEATPAGAAPVTQVEETVMQQPVEGGVPGLQTDTEQQPSESAPAQEEERPAEPVNEAAQGTTVNPQDNEEIVNAKLQKAAEKYGVIPEGEKAARESQIPQQMNDDTAVGRTARTLYEAKATPEERLQDIKNATAKGAFNYIKIPDALKVWAKSASAKIERMGWDASVAQFLADVRSGRRDAETVATGAVLLNNALNGGIPGDQIAELLTAYNSAVHDPAQALAAARIMKTLSPEARLVAIQRMVTNISEDINEKNAAKRNRKKPKTDDVENAVKKAKKTAVEKTAKEWSEFNFPDEAAKRVADSIKRRIKNSFNAKTPNALDTFVNYVKKFAAEKIDTGKKNAKSMTATELLSEIAHNEDLFREIYEKAQAQFSDENSTGYREFISDYLNEPVNLSGAEGQRGKLFSRAIAESAVATGENAKYIRNQSALGISNGVIAEQIARDLILKTGAQGELADSIRQAARRYVETAINSDGTDAGVRTERLVSGMMKNLAASFREIATQDSATKESIAQDLADQLAIEYGLDPESAKVVAENATEEYNRQLAEAMEKEVARRFAPKEAKERTVKSFTDSLTEAINLGAFDSEYAEQAVDKLFGTDGGVTLDPALLEEYSKQTTEKGRDEVVKKMMKNIASQLPSTFMDKWNAFRYLNMLGNFKTQGRNLLGNLMMGLSTAVKSRVGALIEAGTSATGIYKGERTKSLWAGHKLYGEAWNDYENVKDVAESEGKYQDNISNLPRAIQKEKTIFKNNGKWGTDEAKTAVGRSLPVKAARKVSDFANKGLEGYRKATTWAMEEGDNIFLRLTYMDALGGYLAANKVKSISEASPELLERARAYAIQQAQEATFHDNNGVSEWASSFDRGWDRTAAGKVAKTIAQGIVPFRKTPANVLVRAEEYSPVGIFNTFVKAVQTAAGKPGVTGADVIESLSKTMTGSALTILGYMLGLRGDARAKGSDDKKKRKLEAEQGKQDYSLILGDGSSLSLSWAAPASIPFFMGVRLAEAMDGESPYTILTLLGGVTDPVLEMSMLSGLNDALDNIDKYNGDIDAVPAFMLNSLFSYLTQGLTNSLVGQAEQASEEYRQSTYTDKESSLPSSLQYAISRAGAKIPGKDYNQQDYIDAWGRRVENGTKGERFFSSFFSPAYKKEDRSTPIDAELERLYDATGVNILPTERKPERSMKINDETLTPEEFEQYSISRGEMAYNMIEGFINSDEYKDMADQDRAEVIDSLYQFAADQAKKEIARGRDEEYKNTDWNKMESLYENDPDDAANYLSVKTEASNAIESNDYAALDKLLEDGGAYDSLSDEAREYLGESNATLKRLAGMREDGLNAEAGMTAIQAVKEAGGSNAKQSEKVDAIIGTDLTDKEKIAAIKTYTSDSYVEKMQAALDSGVSLEKWSEVRNKYAEISDTEGLSAMQKATQFAAALDKDKSLTEKQRQVLREQLTYSSMSTAEAKRYDELTETGMSIDTATKVTDLLSSIKPLDGKTSVTQNQKIDAIINGGLNDADTWAALKVYTSDSWYKNAETAYKKGIDLDDYVRMFREADLPNDKGETNGQLSQAELYAFYMQDQKANEKFCKVMLMILNPSKDWDKFLREQARAAKKSK